MPGVGNPKVSFRLDAYSISRLRQLAASMGFSLSELLREIVFAYLGGE